MFGLSVLDVAGWGSIFFDPIKNVVNSATKSMSHWNNPLGDMAQGIQSNFYGNWNDPSLGVSGIPFLPVGKNPQDSIFANNINAQKQQIRDYQKSHPTKKVSKHKTSVKTSGKVGGLPSNLLIYGIGAVLLLLVLEK